MKTRIIKIQRRYRKINKCYKSVPEITLCGNWLEISGFNAGKTINVKMAKGKLTISLND